MRATVLLSLAVFVMGLSGNAFAERRWTLELKPGMAIPTDDLGQADLRTGVGFEGKVAYRFLPHLAAYAGWDWHHFSIDEADSPLDTDVEETGYAFGFEFIHPLGDSRLSYLLRAGATLNHIELENDDGDIVADSDHGLGWDIGAGIVYSVHERWRIAPGLRYRSLSRDLQMGGETVDVDLTYIALEIGVMWLF